MKHRLLIAVTIFFISAASVQAALPKRLQLYNKIVEIRQNGADIFRFGANGSDIGSSGQIFVRPGGSAADAFFDGSANVAAQWLSLNPTAKNTSADTLQLKVNSATGIGLFAEQTGTGFAAWFAGSVNIAGSLSSTAPKPAEIDRPNASPLYLFAREAPESRFEDFGTATLVHGQATVLLDTTFREATEHSADYFVFLTPQQGTGRVAVGHRNADSFTVLGDHDGVVGYNIVAVRHGDAGLRFTKKDLP